MLKTLLLLAMTSITLTSCAAGSATSAYSLKALTADGLTAEAENRIVDRIKRESARDYDQCGADVYHTHPICNHQ